MALDEYEHRLAPELLRAIEAKGYADLTAVQRAVLDPALDGRDLRITSQTGSGKTLAIGFSLRSLIGPSPAEAGVARPHALVIEPTRELAHQVEQELKWLYAEREIRLATTTGGASYRDEHRALSRGPSIVVGTPGRLLDHLKRGSIDPSQVSAVVLDEADRILELGFRDDLLAILDTLPSERRTHLVSATFPHVVRSLADRVQRDAAHVEGSRLGAANVDIDHVIHIVDPAQRLDALINLLLAYPEDQTLVFVRTRADAAHVANELVMAGFAASGLSGEMDQTARNRTLSAFKQSGLRVLVATDVAARGIDAQNVTRVVHAELPTNPDAYTHRAGRTGRAGRKGISSLLVAPSGVVHATRLLRGLRVQHRVEPIPSAEQIERAADERLLAELTAEHAAQIAPEPSDTAADGGEQEAALGGLESESALARWIPLATRLIQAGSLERTLSRLLAHSRANLTRPREIRVFAERPAARDAQGRESERMAESGRARGQAPRRTRDAHDRAGADAPERAANGGGPFRRFQVTWGRQQGADARRMLAMVCRRGEIRGRDVGAIEIADRHSIVEVADSVADGFERATRRPDPREPNVLIRREQTAHAPGPRRPKTGFKPRRDRRKSAAQRPLKRKTPK